MKIREAVTSFISVYLYVMYFFSVVLVIVCGILFWVNVFIGDNVEALDSALYVGVYFAAYMIAKMLIYAEALDKKWILN